MTFPTHVHVPSLDEQYADLGLPPLAYQVCGKSESAEGAVHLQVFTGSGYLWLSPSQYRPATPPTE